MAETPEQIWINKVFGRHPGDWNFTDGQHLTRKQLREKVKYVRADVVEADKQLAITAALREAHDAIADYPRVAPDGVEAQHYDEQIGHSQSIILALIPDGGSALDRALALERALALANERERCAKVAYDAGCGWQELRSAALSSQWPEDAAKHLASEHAAFAIAAAIRAQKENPDGNKF